jgi:hypothetical protein
MGMKDRYFELATMAALLSTINDTPTGTGKQKIGDIDFSPKEPPIPKGCKEYFFTQNGGFSTDKMRKDECVFKCVAMNDKSAKKKFQKYITNK